MEKVTTAAREFVFEIKVSTPRRVSKLLQSLSFAPPHHHPFYTLSLIYNFTVFFFFLFFFFSHLATSYLLPP